ncbi:MAG: GxxExxY protein [Gemmatimonadetes bacterium]|nr:GxxExxY protein [Gemmatimonadota bacterium]
MANRMDGLLYEDLTRSIIGAFFEVYNELGHGFLESVYTAALEIVLRERGHHVSREVRVMVHFRGIPIARQRMDMVVDDKVIVENKATRLLALADFQQILSYVTSTKLEVGLLLHYGPEPKFHRTIRSNRGAVKSA